MPLSDDASLFIPYTVHWLENPGGVEQFCAVQMQGDDIIYASPIFWPTKEEAEQHAADLNYLRERTVERLGTTTLWVAVDISPSGPEALMVFERIMKDQPQVVGWRSLNPAADGDNFEWTKRRELILNAMETFSMEELPEDSESLFDHLKNRHGHFIDGLTDEDVPHWIKRHREKLHGPNRPESALDHTHEWNDEEGVADDASAEEEGAHEDTDS